MVKQAGHVGICRNGARFRVQQGATRGEQGPKEGPIWVKSDEWQDLTDNTYRVYCHALHRGGLTTPVVMDTSPNFFFSWDDSANVGAVNVQLPWRDLGMNFFLQILIVFCMPCTGHEVSLFVKDQLPKIMLLVRCAERAETHDGLRWYKSHQGWSLQEGLRVLAGVAQGSRGMSFKGRRGSALAKPLKPSKPGFLPKNARARRGGGFQADNARQFAWPLEWMIEGLKWISSWHGILIIDDCRSWHEHFLCKQVTLQGLCESWGPFLSTRSQVNSCSTASWGLVPQPR